MADYKIGGGGSEKGHKRSPEKGAIKMRMVGALVLKWSQKVNGMTHKRRSRRGAPHQWLLCALTRVYAIG